MKVLIIDMSYERNSLWKVEFVSPIEDILKKIRVNYEIIHFLEIDLDVVKKYDKIILSGVALKDFEYVNHLEKFDWISEIKKPILGICAGAQIIGLIFGSELRKGEEIGLQKPKILKSDKILKEVNLNEIYCLHNSYVEVPIGFELLVKTKYPQIFKKGEIYGVLFHPEVRNKELIENFVNL